MALNSATLQALNSACKTLVFDSAGSAFLLDFPAVSIINLDMELT
jgi:hypothetical protein